MSEMSTSRLGSRSATVLICSCGLGVSLCCLQCDPLIVNQSVSQSFDLVNDL
jgi:hypothetical protein